MIATLAWLLLGAWLAPSGALDDVLVRVGVGPDKFDPSRVTIEPGDTVKWANIDDFHTVTSGYRSTCADATLLFDEPLHTGAPVFAYRFQYAGRHHYYCVPHEKHGMKGIVDVKALSLLGEPKASGQVQWQVDGLPPESEGKVVRILLSGSGSDPGVPLACLGEVPLVPDVWTSFSIAHPSLFTTSVVTNGQATTPPLALPSWLPPGLTISSVGLVQDPATGIPERILPALEVTTR